jgi:hypothetical protein
MDRGGELIDGIPPPFPRELFAQWEQFSVPAERFELIGAPDRKWTPAERSAGENSSLRLSQGDPMPQTLYRCAAQPDRPVLLKLRLKIGP